ncbi:MAG: 50S ribosomal protein L15 [Candidatus Cloacimonetes bacterium]|nr:50S ribosomal protein L15 [Candidatus Cloacimonadota bacterium]
MYSLNQIQRPNIKKKTKRLGKGQATGWGHQAGRGHKGQKARSGGKVPIWFEGGQMPIQRRLPKRGFKNWNRVEYRIVNLAQLVALDEIDIDVAKMEELGLISSSGKKGQSQVKILANTETEFKKTVNIKANAFSENAKRLIEANGGKAEVV